MNASKDFAEEISKEISKKLSKGQITAQKILEAAARCIAKVGIEKTSVTNIAKEAVLKRSLIAYHFPKKAEIFFKVISHIAEELMEKRTEMTTGTSGRLKLERILLSYSDYFYEKNHNFNCFLHFQYLASIDGHYKKLNDQITKNALDVIKSAIDEVMSEEKIQASEKLVLDFAEALYMRLIGVIMRYYTTNHQFSTDDYQKRYITILREEIRFFIVHAREKDVISSKI